MSSVDPYNSEVYGGLHTTWGPFERFLGTPRRALWCPEAQSLLAPKKDGASRGSAKEGEMFLFRFQIVLLHEAANMYGAEINTNIILR